MKYSIFPAERQKSIHATFSNDLIFAENWENLFTIIFEREGERLKLVKQTVVKVSFDWFDLIQVS